MDTLAWMPEPAVIALEGELDVHRAHALAPQLSEAAGARNEDLIIDLSDVTLLDSSALGAIFQAQHDLERHGRTSPWSRRTGVLRRSCSTCPASDRASRSSRRAKQCARKRFAACGADRGRGDRQPGRGVQRWPPTAEPPPANTTPWTLDARAPSAGRARSHAPAPSVQRAPRARLLAREARGGDTQRPPAGRMNVEDGVGTGDGAGRERRLNAVKAGSHQRVVAPLGAPDALACDRGSVDGHAPAFNVDDASAQATHELSLRPRDPSRRCGRRR
jgi:ABC-type transporter Mla MlaB component